MFKHDEEELNIKEEIDREKEAIQQLKDARSKRKQEKEEVIGCVEVIEKEYSPESVIARKMPLLLSANDDNLKSEMPRAEGSQIHMKANNYYLDPEKLTSDESRQELFVDEYSAELEDFQAEVTSSRHQLSL